MRRLIKKADFYTADEMRNVMSGQKEYTEIFKNPTNSELSEVYKISEYGVARMVVTPDGTLFAWSGDILHHTAKRYIEEYKDFVHIETDLNELYFSNIGVSDEFIQSIKNAKQNFENCGFYEDSPFKICGYGSLGKLDGCAVLRDIYNL